MEIVRPEPGVAFGAFPLSRLVSGLQAGEAEDVKALGEDGVFPLHFARRARHHFLLEKGENMHEQRQVELFNAKQILSFHNWIMERS